MRVACVLVTYLRAKVEMGRQPDLKEWAVLIIDHSQGRPVFIDRFPSASGVAVGMILEQALSRQSESVVPEADEAAYCRAFHRTLVIRFSLILHVMQGQPNQLSHLPTGSYISRAPGSDSRRSSFVSSNWLIVLLAFVVLPC